MYMYLICKHQCLPLVYSYNGEQDVIITFLSETQLGILWSQGSSINSMSCAQGSGGPEGEGYLSQKAVIV